MYGLAQRFLICTVGTSDRDGVCDLIDKLLKCAKYLSIGALDMQYHIIWCCMCVTEFHYDHSISMRRIA